MSAAVVPGFMVKSRGSRSEPPIFTAILSGTIVALALLAQATHFGPETLSFALLLFSVTLFIGLTTFVRSVTINYEDARCVARMIRALASDVGAVGVSHVVDAAIGIVVSLVSAAFHVRYAARFRQSHAPSTRSH